MNASSVAATPQLATTSWDDGHPSDLRVVAALLEKHGLSGTFYIPCTNSEGRPVMRAAEIAELGRQFEIRGHTRDHVILTDLAPRLTADQILTNKQGIRRSLTWKCISRAIGRKARPILATSAPSSSTFPSRDFHEPA